MMTVDRKSMTCRHRFPFFLVAVLPAALQAQLGQPTVTLPAQAEAQASEAIAWSEIGAKASADYQGDAIGITATEEGARLRTGFQKLSATVASDGLTLHSTGEGGGSLHLVSCAIGREGR